MKRLGDPKLRAVLVSGVAGLLSLISNAVLSRGLGVSSRGDFARVMAIAQVVSIVSGAGWADAALFGAAKDHARRALVVRRCLRGAMPLAAVSAVAVGAYALLVAGVVGLLAAGFVLIDAALAIRRCSFVGAGRSGRAALAELAVAATRFGLFALLGSLDGLSLESALIISMVAVPLAGHGVLGFARPVPKAAMDELAAAEAAELASYARRSLAGVILFAINSRCDQAVMGFRSSSATLGAYASAVSLAEGPSTIAIGGRFVLTGELASSKRFARATRLVVAGTAAWMVLAALAQPVVPAVARLAFGSGFDAAQRPLQLLGFATGFFAGNAYLNAILLAGGRPGGRAVSNGASAFVSVVGTIAFGYQSASLAAGVALASNLMSFSVSWYLCTRLATPLPQALRSATPVGVAG